MTTYKNYRGKVLDQYDRDFYEWTIDRRLGDPFNLWIQDIDGLVRDRKGNLLLLEIKRRNFEPKPYQARNMAILDEILKAGIEALGGKVTITQGDRLEVHEITFHGFKLLQLSGDRFAQSDFTLDGEPISAEDLVKTLSFGEVSCTAASAASDYP